MFVNTNVGTVFQSELKLCSPAHASSIAPIVSSCIIQFARNYSALFCYAKRPTIVSIRLAVLVASRVTVQTHIVRNIHTLCCMHDAIEKVP